MQNESQSLVWTAQFQLAPSHTTSHLPGDKILLPPSALEQLLAAAPTVTSDSPVSHAYTSNFDPFNPYSYAAERRARNEFQNRYQQLPHPLTFRLVNPSNGRVIYAGIREFSAEDGQIGLSPFLRHALGLEEGAEGAKAVNGNHGPSSDVTRSPTITVHAKQLEKGTFVKLRPIEAGYNPEDWKALLEEYMRKNFTTLTKGELLTVPNTQRTKAQTNNFEFLVDEIKPDGDGICVVDTDLEVDIEALNEEQARETLRRIAAKAQKAPGTTEGSSTGGQLNLFKANDGQVLDGEYVDYELQSWPRSQGLEFELTLENEESELFLFANPVSTRQQARPRDDEHVFGDFEGRPKKRIRLAPTNVELENVDSLWVSVHAMPNDSSAPPSSPHKFSIRARSSDLKQDEGLQESDKESMIPGPDETQCKNCLQIVPKQSLVLHENFCFRNNILCPHGCSRVLQKRSEQWENHWHCPYDTSSGDTVSSHHQHDRIFHEEQKCPNCNFVAPSLPQLAQHRTSTCPGKLILCSFCHLVVPQEGDPDGEPNPEALLSGLTPHELADGARTTECHICQRIVRLRDMTTHLKNHDMERTSRSVPRLCRNVNCGRTLDGVSRNGDTRSGTRMGQGAGNEILLCSTCFGPLYVSMFDPEGKALKRRVERRYLGQLLTGCGKPWCQNDYCKKGRQNRGQDAGFTTKDALPLIKPLIDGLSNNETPLHFCVDESSQKRRGLAEMLSADIERTSFGKQYGFEWCVAALEAESNNLEKAREWLQNFAPVKNEAR